MRIYYIFEKSLITFCKDESWMTCLFLPDLKNRDKTISCREQQLRISIRITVSEGECKMRKDGISFQIQALPDTI